MAAVVQKGSTPDPKILVPLPTSWTPLVNTEFIPVYNVFDLNHSAFLSRADASSAAVKNAAIASDGEEPMPLTRSGVANCEDGPAPKHLFLLTPAAYLKPDPGGLPANTAQFENEARSSFFPNPSVGTAKVDLLMLTRQFFLIGCDSDDPDVVQAEWTHLLEAGFNQLLRDLGRSSPVSPRTCGNYVNGLLAGRSFVELRNTYSVNERLVEAGARHQETVGQAFAAGFAGRLNHEGIPASSPLLEVVRLPDPLVTKRFGAATIRLRFHTTVSRVLDQVYITEGDEIRAGSIPEDLR